MLRSIGVLARLLLAFVVLLAPALATAQSDATERAIAQAARASERGRTELATQVAAAARAIGYELLALRADLLAGGDAGRQALAVLERQGIATEGVPPLLLY